MKLLIDGKEYEISEECMASLARLLKIAMSKAKLPTELEQSLEHIDSFKEEELKAFVGGLRDYGLDFYCSLSMPRKLATIGACRGLIAWMQMRIENEEVRGRLRVPRRVDPVEHLVSIFHPIIENSCKPIAEYIHNVVIECSTKEDNTISSVEFAQSRSGGTLATNGDIRKWEDNRR